MIEINLLPRTGRRAGRRMTGISVAAIAAPLAGKIRDPFLAGAVGALLLAVLSIGGLQLRHQSRSAAVAVAEREALQDSTRYTAILNEKRAAEAQRDSIVRQMEIIRSIDNDRYIWPHIMAEVSQALPPYTWLTSLNQTSAIVSRAAKPDSAAAADSSQATSTMPTQFRLVGQTVDIQALTRFMKQLEASPFVRNVQLARTNVAAADGQQVTEFQLDAEYEVPPPSSVRMVPVTLSAR